MRLLLAEDERDLADALEAMLKHNNYSVDVVNNGQDALDYLMLDDYDGAILDVMMPQMDGVTVVKKLREIFEAECLSIGCRNLFHCKAFAIFLTNIGCL